MELGLTTPFGAMRLIDEVPSHDRFDIKTPAASPPAHRSVPCSTSESRAGGPARCLPWAQPRSTETP